MLSLVNAPTVAFDLVRRPGGAEAADVLLAALWAGPDELNALETSVSDVDPELRAADRRIVRGVLERGGPVPLASALGELAEQLTDPLSCDHAVRAVATMPLCGGTDLASLLTDDVLGWTRTSGDPGSDRLWPVAAEVLLDALAGTLAGPALTCEQHDRLSAPLRRAGLSPQVGELGPNSAAVRSRLTLAAELDPERAAGIAHVHASAPGWTLAMHRACWAVHLSGRIRPAAVAQFALAREVARRPDRLRLAGEGTFTALSGAVHAELVADLLDDESRTRLLAPLQS